MLIQFVLVVRCKHMSLVEKEATDHVVLFYEANMTIMEGTVAQGVQIKFKMKPSGHVLNYSGS